MFNLNGQANGSLLRGERPVRRSSKTEVMRITFIPAKRGYPSPVTDLFVMNWPRWNPDLAGNVRTLLLVVVVLIVLGVAFIFVPSPLRNFYAGFGPEWECTSQAQGGPTCIKKSGRQN